MKLIYTSLKIVSNWFLISKAISEIKTKVNYLNQDSSASKYSRRLRNHSMVPDKGKEKSNFSTLSRSILGPM